MKFINHTLVVVMFNACTWKAETKERIFSEIVNKHVLER